MTGVSKIMKKLFMDIFALSTILCLSGCLARHASQADKHIEYSISDIHNKDIGWNFTPMGIILPEVYGQNANNILKHLPDNEIDLLLECLKDKDKYVAAHVLLTLIAKPIVRSSVSNMEWNHLKINIIGTYKHQDMPSSTILTRYKCNYEGYNNQRRIIQYWADKRLKGKIKRRKSSPPIKIRKIRPTMQP